MFFLRLTKLSHQLEQKLVGQVGKQQSPGDTHQPKVQVTDRGVVA